MLKLTLLPYLDYYAYPKRVDKKSYMESLSFS